MHGLVQAVEGGPCWVVLGPVPRQGVEEEHVLQQLLLLLLLEQQHGGWSVLKVVLWPPTGIFSLASLPLVLPVSSSS